MPQKAKSTQKRVKVKDLPKKGKKLSKGEQKKVKGGEAAASNYNTWRTNFGRTS